MANITTNATTTVVLDIRGMTCSACERHVGEALATVPGVSALSVSRAPGTATVEWATAVPNLGALVDAVRSAGYDASVNRVSGDVTLAQPTPSSRPACHCCEVHG
jgi:Cu+-exporting ATPase